VNGCRTIDRRSRLWFWIAACLLLWLSAAEGADDVAPMLSASVDKQTAKVGEQVRLTLTYRLPKGTRLADPLEIKGVEDLTLVHKTVAEGEIHLAFIVDRVDAFTIGPFGLVFTDGRGRSQQIDSQPIHLDVASNLVDQPEAAELRPIEGIMPTVWRWHVYLLWGTAASVLIGALLGFFWWRKRRGSGQVAMVPTVPPHAAAEQAIDRLIARGRFEKGETKPFYFELSEILRRYMGAIRPFPAAEMTTEEIARSVGGNAHDRDLLPLLRQADVVKFADAVPTPAQKDRDVQAARAYIRRTRQTAIASAEADR
jgi:hypothetical protein